MGIREYICRIQKTLTSHLSEAHNIPTIPSDNTGVFLDEHTKIASIGVQVRHRLTSHGFAINVTSEPVKWFEEVVACGLTDVKAGNIAEATRSMSVIEVEGEMDQLVQRFGQVFERDMVKLDLESDVECGEAIRAVEEEARKAGEWLHTPLR